MEIDGDQETAVKCDVCTNVNTRMCRYFEWDKTKNKLNMRQHGIDFADIKVPTKQPVTLRLDTDVLMWFKSQGQGYQTRINKLYGKPDPALEVQLYRLLSLTALL